jgi:hypothetical protein
MWSRHGRNCRSSRWYSASASIPRRPDGYGRTAFGIDGPVTFGIGWRVQRCDFAAFDQKGCHVAGGIGEIAGKEFPDIGYERRGHGSFPDLRLLGLYANADCIAGQIRPDKSRMTSARD